MDYFSYYHCCTCEKLNSQKSINLGSLLLVFTYYTDSSKTKLISQKQISVSYFYFLLLKETYFTSFLKHICFNHMSKTNEPYKYVDITPKRIMLMLCDIA